MTRTTQSNLHKLLSVQELISAIHIPMYDLPLQQLNMKWANKCQTDLMYCTWSPDASMERYVCILSIASLQNVKPTLLMTVNVKLPLYSIPLDHQMSLLGVHLHCISSNYELLNIEECIQFTLCCCSCCCSSSSSYCFMSLLLLICHCASTITDEQQQNYMVRTKTTTEGTKTLNSINFSIFLFWLIMLLPCNFFFIFWFVCSCGSTVKDAEQQQHDTVATTNTQKDQST